MNYKINPVYLPFITEYLKESNKFDSSYVINLDWLLYSNSLDEKYNVSEEWINDFLSKFGTKGGTVEEVLTWFMQENNYEFIVWLVEKLPCIDTNVNTVSAIEKNTYCLNDMILNNNYCHFDNKSLYVKGTLTVNDTLTVSENGYVYAQNIKAKNIFVYGNGQILSNNIVSDVITLNQNSSIESPIIQSNSINILSNKCSINAEFINSNEMHFARQAKITFQDY